MTEAEWLACEDPEALLRFLKTKASQRKLRLYFVACCERVAYLFVDAKSRAALACARRYADGLASARELGDATRDAKEAWGSALYRAIARRGSPFDVGAVGEVRASDPTISAASAVQAVTDTRFESYGQTAAEYAARAIELAGGAETRARERAAQATLFREIFGNPFRPVAFSPQWRTDTAILLAKQMYAAREFDAMPILADALQDAGCDSDDALNHLRDTSLAHVRGCWVVDLVLGKP